jgi:hypothetical protein
MNARDQLIAGLEQANVVNALEFDRISLRVLYPLLSHLFRHQFGCLVVFARLPVNRSQATLAIASKATRPREIGVGPYDPETTS